MASETIHGTRRTDTVDQRIGPGPCTARGASSRRNRSHAAARTLAELRRRLPPGAPVQDYAFQQGPADLNAGDSPTRSVRLSELFSGPDRSVVVYHFMYGKKQTDPCPCARCGSTGSTASDIIWRRTLTSSSPPLPIRPPCARRPQPGMAQPSAAQLWNEHVQVRPGQRRRRRQPGFDHLGLHARPRRHAPPRLLRASPDGRGYQGTRNRFAVTGLQPPRPDTRGARRLVRQAHVSGRPALAAPLSRVANGDSIAAVEPADCTRF